MISLPMPTVATDHLPFLVQKISSDNLGVVAEHSVVASINRCGLFLCTSGTLRALKDGRTYCLERGNIYIYLPSTVVQIVGCSEDMTGYIVDVRADYVLPMMGNLVSLSDLVSLRTNPFLALTEQMSRSLSAKIEDIMAKSCEGSMFADVSENQKLTSGFFSAMGRAIFLELMCYYFREQDKDVAPPPRNEVVLQRFIVSLSNNYRLQRSVAFYAGEQNIAPRYFSTIVKQTSGRHALDWIAQTVVADAKQMLLAKQLTIKEISEQLIFPTQTFFGNYFKKYTGLSPKAFRAAKVG